jgi:phosphatidylethanolamine N-methyltransferase
VPPPKPKRRPLTSQHDLLAYYFRKDTLGLRNFDAFRAADFQLLLLLIYAVGLAVLPAPGGPRAFFVHALGWTLFNTFGLGLLLRAQGERKALVRHFVQHYHYPAQDGARGAVREAFANWKQLYNTSMCMTYGARFRAQQERRSADGARTVSAFGLAWKTYRLPETWITGNALLMHTFGVVSASRAGCMRGG